MEQKEVIELSKVDIVKIIAKEYGVTVDDVRFGNHPHWISAIVTKSIKQDGDVSEYEKCRLVKE